MTAPGACATCGRAPDVNWAETPTWRNTGVCRDCRIVEDGEQKPVPRRTRLRQDLPHRR